MRKCGDHDKDLSRDSDLHASSTPEWERIVFKCRLMYIRMCVYDYSIYIYMCLYICMCAPLVSELLTRLYSYSVFQGYSIMGQRPLNMNSLP
jgi:hypothetical protein